MKARSVYQERLCQTGEEDAGCPNIIWTDKNISNAMKCIVYLAYLTNNTGAFTRMYRTNKCTPVKYALLRTINHPYDSVTFPTTNSVLLQEY
jgi:hypothetical protein